MYMYHNNMVEGGGVNNAHNMVEGGGVTMYQQHGRRGRDYNAHNNMVEGGGGGGGATMYPHTQIFPSSTLPVVHLLQIPTDQIEQTCINTK